MHQHLHQTLRELRNPLTCVVKVSPNQHPAQRFINKVKQGKPLITHLQRVLVCESTGLKAPQLCSITKICLCLMLFVYQTQTIAFHGLQVYSPPSRDNVERIQTPLAREQSCESVAHRWAGGRARANGNRASPIVRVLHQHTSKGCKLRPLQDKEGAVGKRTYPVLFAALSDLHKREQQRCLHQVLHLYFRCY